jgi:hypothetical protein
LCDFRSQKLTAVMTEDGAEWAGGATRALNIRRFGAFILTFNLLTGIIPSQCLGRLYDEGRLMRGVSANMQRANIDMPCLHQSPHQNRLLLLRRIERFVSQRVVWRGSEGKHIS